MSLLWRRRSELHPDQLRAIQGVAVDGKYLLVGPPGSGKTSILLHRGQFLRLAPHNLANATLVVFTRTLREFIAVSGDERFPPALIQTMNGFVDHIFSVYGRDAPKYRDVNPLDERNRLRAVDAIGLVDNEERRIHYAAILVDEVQDLWPEEVRLFMRLTNRLMLAGDSHQRMHDVTGGIETAITDGCAKLELKHHYRISPQICRVADSILVHDGYYLSEFCHYQGPPPSDPITVGMLSREGQLEKLVEALDLQLDTYNDPADVLGIVTWRTDDCDYIYEHLIEYERFSESTRLFHSGIKGRQFDSGCKICVVTIQSCKGLEFRALHWMFADENTYWTTRDRAYTVVTRAKSSLAVYHNAPLPAILAGAFAPVGRGLFEDDDHE